MVVCECGEKDEQRERQALVPPTAWSITHLLFASDQTKDDTLCTVYFCTVVLDS